ncbi:uncharacterized protein LOC128210938 [Mya arenaria]|uniref:uncharacterized protein LOC128210938 n=1 Tax=Mya arenaria TaxID=6604 RepID=UPI0022E72D1E|nr:uncharacterized protein LOC128210938 [Mya arenaria]
MEQRDCDVGKEIAAQNSASQTCTKGDIKGLGEIQKGTYFRKTNTADTVLNRYISVAKNKEKVNKERGLAKGGSKGEKHKQRKDNTEDNGIMKPSDLYKISRSDSSKQPAKRQNRKRCHRKSKCFQEMVRCSVLKTLAMMHIEIQILQNRRHKLQANVLKESAKMDQHSENLEDGPGESMSKVEELCNIQEE